MYNIFNLYLKNGMNNNTRTNQTHSKMEENFNPFA